MFQETEMTVARKELIDDVYLFFEARLPVGEYLSIEVDWMKNIHIYIDRSYLLWKKIRIYTSPFKHLKNDTNQMIKCVYDNRHLLMKQIEEKYL